MRAAASYTRPEPSTYELEIEQHAGLVKRIANHMVARLPAGVQVDDLVQAGLIGLLEAARQYDPSQGASFETYATIRIRGAMLDEIRSNNWAPRSVFRKARMLSETIREIEHAQGRDARPGEIAAALGVSLDEYHQLLMDANGHTLFSLDDMNESDQGRGSSGDLYDEVEREEFKRSLAEQIEHLPERERMVLALYYDEELTLREIGEVLEVSESRVCQILSQATARLRGRLQEWL